MAKSEDSIYHRRSLRLKGYDYSQAGGYAITICVQDKYCMFGHVKDHQMHLNDVGIMVEKWWLRVSENNVTDVTQDSWLFIIYGWHALGVHRRHEHVS